MDHRPINTLKITYCPQCGWLLRAAWLAQEALTSFHAELSEVSLIPSKEGGVFKVQLNDECIWERKRDGGFPQAAEFKRRLRNQLAPERDLGHIDHQSD